MEKQGELHSGRSVLTLFQFVLLALFAFSSLLLAAASVRVCRLTEENSAANSALRTSLAYVAGKIRAGDRAGRIEICSQSGTEALAIHKDIDGVEYSTYIYYYDGALREYFSQAALPFDAESGTAIASLSGFRAEYDGRFITLCVTDNGGVSHTQRLLLRTGGGL